MEGFRPPDASPTGDGLVPFRVGLLAMDFDEFVEYCQAFPGASHRGPWEGNVVADEDRAPGEATP